MSQRQARGSARPLSRQTQTAEARERGALSMQPPAGIQAPFCREQKNNALDETENKNFKFGRWF